MSLSQVYWCLLVVFGAFTIYQDFRFGKITNRVIICGLVAGGTGYMFLLVNSILGYWRMEFVGLGTYYLPLSFYPRVLIYAGLSLAAALTLWYLRIWPAGDAKLFIVLSLLAVLINPNLSGFPKYSFLILLVNIFIPAALFVVLALSAEILEMLTSSTWTLRMIQERVKSHLKTAQKRIMDEWPKRYIYLILGVNLFFIIFAFRALTQGFARVLHGGLINLIFYFSLFFLWGKIIYILRRPDVALASLGVMLGVVLPVSLLFRWNLIGQIANSLKMYFDFFVILTLGKTFFVHILDERRLIEIPVGRLESGAVLSEKAWLEIDAEGGKRGESFEKYADGLSRSDIDVLAKWWNDRLEKTVFICQTVPFAFWIFGGTMWTLLCRKNFIRWMIDSVR